MFPLQDNTQDFATIHLLFVLLQGVLQWEAVEAAVQSGCHSISGILAHITQQAQQASTASEQQQQQQDEAAESDAVSREQMQQQPAEQQPELVSKEHLGRCLKAWCDEGRLVKPARGWYELPS
jgi:hypothetical protein